jgi:ABC-type antimicrobial peptide transport system permease subunit
MTMVVRPSADAERITRRLREVAEGLGTRVMVERIRTGEEWLGERIVTPRQRTVLLGLLGGIGLLLALVGVFGLTGYAVARRTREIGVRMTFGARPGQVVGSIVRDSAVPVFVGIALGLLGGYFATRVIESFLFETAPTEPATFAAVAIVLGLTGCVAAWIPARRAASVDPMSALRIE